MKKFLSLVLALAMAMSLVVINTSAKEFTDDGDITYGEAVDVVSEIGVVDGYTDGSFNPQGGLTRGAAAKIICNLILGPTTAAELNATTAPFSDVSVNNEFAGYIAYCSQRGIISGYADGTFRPANPLTGYAFMKMLLGALGYDQYTEGYTGDNWSIQVAKQAIGIGLNAGLADEFNGIDYVTREEACLYAFNTLQADLVEYETVINTTINGQTVTIGNSTPQAKKWGNSATRINNIKDDEYIQFAEQYFNKLVKEDDTDDFMRPAYTWVYDKTEIGTYVDYSLMVSEYTTGITGKDLYDELGRSAITGNYVYYYVDGKDDSTVKAENMIRTNTRTYTTTGNGVLTQVFFDKDAEEITIVSINTYLAEATSDYDADDEELMVKIYADSAKQGEDDDVSLEEVAGIEDYQDEDRFLVNVAWDGSHYNIVDVFDVESMTDVDLTKYSENSYVVTGGDQYDYALTGKLSGTPGSLNEITTYGTDALSNYSYNLYLDQYGYLIGNEVYEGNANYLFLTGYDLRGSNLANANATANAIFLDGTMSPITVDVKATNENIGTTAWYKQLTKGSEDGQSEYNKWFTYTTKTVNGETVYTLDPVEYWMNVEYFNEGKVNSYDFRANYAQTTTSHATIASDTRNAWGNDDSVYITVKAEAVSATTYMGITEVLASYTGVEDVDITVKASASNALEGATYSTSTSTDNAPNNAFNGTTGALHNGDTDGKDTSSIYIVKDKDDYVIGAVILGEDSTSTEDYAYVLEDLDSEWIEGDDTFWSFKAVVNGEIVTLTARDTNMSIATLRSKIVAQTGLGVDGMMQLTYDRDGYVVDAEAVTDAVTNNKKYSNTSPDDNNFGSVMDPDKFNVYGIQWTTTPANFKAYSGRTLYGAQNDAGLRPNTDAPVIVVWQENYTSGGSDLIYKSYSNLSTALNALQNSGSFQGWVSAVLADNGNAEYIVIKDANPVLVTDDDGDSKDPVTNINKVVLSNDQTGTITLTDANSNPVANGNYEYTLYMRGPGQATYDKAVTSTVAVTSGTGTISLPGVTGQLYSYYVVVDGVPSNEITIAYTV